jgi:hypothetical protein
MRMICLWNLVSASGFQCHVYVLLSHAEWIGCSLLKPPRNISGHLWVM